MPETIGVPTTEAASSSNVRLAPLTLVPPPSSLISETAAPSGLTSSTSTSAGQPWAKPRRVAVTLLMVPGRSARVIVLGYGEPEALSTIVMAAAFVAPLAVSVVPPRRKSNVATPRSSPLSSSARVAVSVPPHSPVAVKVKDWVTEAPPANRAP